MKDGISVIMPVYNQGSFIRAAIMSLSNQSFENWELIIINDGCSDNSENVILEFSNASDRIQYFANSKNKGLGACLNIGLSLAKFKYIAYLPADDLYFSDHLLTLYHSLTANPAAIMCYSWIKHNYRDTGFESKGDISLGRVRNQYFQLVQVLHRKVDVQWTERNELVTEDLDKMFFSKLVCYGGVVSTSRVTAEWVSHANQRHRKINEFQGGNIHIYKKFYSVSSKIRFQSLNGSFIDELNDFETKPVLAANKKKDTLKILLVGELAYNADRISVFENEGHKLFGLWIDKPYYYNTIGPLPFGNIEDIPSENWKSRIDEIKPDIIYALLNILAVPLAHEVMMNCKDIPFVWHFKEGPFFSRQRGDWEMLIDLYEKSDGQIYINEESKNWFGQFLSGHNQNSFILDGDLPYSAYFKELRSSPLSENQEDVHTVIPGRPFGLSPLNVLTLARNKIHLHFYGNQENTYWAWIEKIPVEARPFLHQHQNCLPSQWTLELSKYDAGWLHIFESNNFGEVAKYEWPDFNYPARMSTLAAAGLPMIQKNNSIHTVATQELTRKLEVGLFFSTYEELGEKLRNSENMKTLKENCWKQRSFFCFDHHSGRLIDFFKTTIKEFNVANSFK
jgi:glycosyltransferase involved in cell wall biosynthesis